MFAIPKNESTSIIFTPLGLIRIKKCPRCDSTKFNLIDNNNWFHCWGCRLVENISKLRGIEFV